MGDSESKQFGDKYLGKLEGQLDKKAPVFNKSLFVGAGEGTRNAWDAGTDFANGLNGSAGFGTGQRGAMDSLGGVFSGYGQLGDNNGLTGGQSDAMAGNAALGGQYGALGQAYDPNSSAYKTLRGNIADDTLTGVGSLFASNGRYGSDIMGESAAEGLGNALAGLDYGNMQNNINNQYRSLDSQRGIFGDTFSMGQQGVGNQFGALAGQGATAGQQFGMGQQALGNQQGAIGMLGQIGASQDADSLARRMANADLFDRKHNADWNTLGRATSILGGNAQAGGSTTSNTVPWWQALLGGAATGASIFG
jgi:hypothetical protein